MKDIVKLQGRELVTSDIDFIRQLISTHPGWSRRRLSIELSEAWNWRNAKGDLKDMASRTLLVKLHERGHIELPPRRQKPSNRMAQRRIQHVLHDVTPIEEPLKSLRPLKVINVHEHRHYDALYSCLLSSHHYLGYSSPVGENIKYLVLDNQDRPLACLLFGSSAWSCADRDKFIGWDKEARQHNLNLTTNNTRFLICPWLTVPCLASHILGLVSRRINQDWQVRYGHPVYLLETFVDQRFKGTCYQAANWRHAGETRGRSRNDRDNTLQVPIKSIFLYPLVADYQTKLSTCDVVIDCART
jgi:hypothetical protein